MRPLALVKAANIPRSWLVAAAALTAGCGVTESTVCEETASPVTDDEQLPAGYTVQELLDLAATTEVPATWVDGAATDLTVAVTRSGGSAEWVEAEAQVVRRPGGPPFGTTRTLEYVVCEDYVRFPVTLALDTSDDRLSVSEEAVARGPVRLEFESDTDLLQFSVEVDRPVDEVEGLPPLDELLGDVSSPPERVLITAGFSEPAGPSGAIMVQGTEEHASGSGDDEVVSAWVSSLVDWGGI